LLGSDNFRAGFAVLDKLGLTFDCWGYHTQLAEVADLAGAFPGVTIVLNHIGGPVACGPYEGQRTAQVFDAWEGSVRLVADCPNVVVKVGGFGMPIYGFDYTTGDAGPPSSQRLAEDWKPYVEILIDAYGPERCMFESNFPVDKISYSYTSLWNAFKLIATDLGMTSAQKNDLFFGAAARTYSLPLP
jgi:L-fuconolactonase